jgi:hypothetical protein
MGRAALVPDDLMSGRLVDVLGLPVPSAASYHFVSAPAVEGAVVTVEAWLRSEAQVFKTACAQLLPHLH